MHPSTCARGSVLKAWTRPQQTLTRWTRTWPHLVRGEMPPVLFVPSYWLLPNLKPPVSSLENKLALIWWLGTFTGRTASVHKGLLQICRFRLQVPPCAPTVLSSSSWTSSLKASASFLSEEEGDGASETTVNITKSPVTPKACPTSWTGAVIHLPSPYVPFMDAPLAPLLS